MILTMEQGEIVVVFGIDAAYVPYVAATITSILSNTSAPRFRFIIIHDGVAGEDRRKIESCAQGHVIEWPEITDKRALGIETYDHITRASSYRFAIPDFAPADAKRVIYLDSDLIVLGDLRELSEIDLGENMIGAVFDAGVDFDAFAKRWALPAKRLSYFNAGVLVLDLEKIRATGALESAFELLSSRAHEFQFGDQCVLNLLFWDKWKRLPATWNVQTRMVTPEGDPVATPQEMQTGCRPKLIHYTGAIKPWSRDPYHPFVWEFYRYLRRTPYWLSVNAAAQTTPWKHLRQYIKTVLNLGRLKAC